MEVFNKYEAVERKSYIYYFDGYVKLKKSGDMFYVSDENEAKRIYEIYGNKTHEEIGEMLNRR